jgi:hypothetical protein
VWEERIECVREGKKGGNKLDFSKRRKHSARRGKKIKQGKVSQFKSVKALVVAW